jgi:CitMHS family citrate-Mg2+:H+ or citrate-Ca2+:H+ symporter
VLLAAVHLGRKERRRLAKASVPADLPAPMPASRAATGWRWWFNAVLTVVTLAALFAGALPLPVIFVISTAIALVVNDPDPTVQRERLTAHAGTAMLMVTTMFAAGVFTGILAGTGMLTSMSDDLVASLPDAAIRHLPLATAVTSMPLSLAFDTDSFYFGLLPVLAGAAQAAGGSAVEVGRAALLGQMTTGFPVSPLTPATFLLIGLAEVDLAAHQRQMIPYAFGVTLIMAMTAWMTGAI